jgi:LmbE family N-acetylglucosaminyl deacetylase
MVAVMRERRIEAQATPESAWLPWLARISEALLRTDVPLLRAGRMVVVAPHPDDEVLGCGGLLALHAKAGRVVLVVAVTDGEASHLPLPEPTPLALAAQRRSESADGLHRLTLPAGGVLRLGLPDGRVAQHEHRLIDVLANVLRQGDTVVVPWRLDGHPDHDACGRAAAKACADNGCRLLEMPIWMWHWSTPGDTRVPWHRLVALALPPWARTVKHSALSAHASQLQPRDADTPPVLDAAIVARARREHEYYFAA